MKLILCRGVFNGIDPFPLTPGAILIDDRHIVAIGEDAKTRAPTDAQVLDFRPNFVMPGLIDSHVHLTATGREGAMAELLKASDIEMTIQAVSNLRAALNAGITTVRDCGGIAEIVVAVRGAVESGVVAGPRVIASGAPVTSHKGHCHFWRLEAEGAESIRLAMSRMNELGNDFFKVMVTGGGSTPGTHPRRSQYSQDDLNLMVQEAQRYGKGIIGHAHGTEGIRRAVEAGFTGIEHCSWLARDGNAIEYDEKLVKLMVERGTVICKTIAGFQRWPVEELGEQHPAWESFETFRQMMVAGVRFIAGTDAGIDLTDFSGLSRTLETMVGLGGITAEQAIASATREAAEVLGVGAETGTLTVGKAADCIAVSDDPYKDIRVLRDVSGVVCRGEPVVLK